MGCRCLKTVKPARQSVRKQNERATVRWFHLAVAASDEQAATWQNIVRWAERSLVCYLFRGSGEQADVP
jgi:hypothetical protein